MENALICSVLLIQLIAMDHCPKETHAPLSNSVGVLTEFININPARPTISFYFKVNKGQNYAV